MMWCHHTGARTLHRTLAFIVRTILDMQCFGPLLGFHLQVAECHYIDTLLAISSIFTLVPMVGSPRPNPLHTVSSTDDTYKVHHTTGHEDTEGE